jgi:hypothetical protein
MKGRTQKEEGSSLRCVYDADESRRVSFTRNLDGIFGFLEWSFPEAEDSWLPTRVGLGSRYGSLDEAMAGAKERVEWLSVASV